MNNQCKDCGHLNSSHDQDGCRACQYMAANGATRPCVTKRSAA